MGYPVELSGALGLGIEAYRSSHLPKPTLLHFIAPLGNSFFFSSAGGEKTAKIMEGQGSLISRIGKTAQTTIQDCGKMFLTTLAANAFIYLKNTVDLAQKDPQLPYLAWSTGLPSVLVGSALGAVFGMLARNK